jgi:uncharacterized OB-fold protein
MNDQLIMEIPPVAPGIFKLPLGEETLPRLLGGFCSACERHYFPRSKYCPICLGDLAEADLGSTGTVYSFTVVRTRAPLGLPEPYGIGYVDLDGTGLRIFCLLDPNCIDRFEAGLPVRLAVGPLGHDGRGAPRLRPFFTPQHTGEERNE